MRKGHQTGFTLIELLVVIAIISVLAGILLPVLAKAQSRARLASCVSNSRQVGIGMQLYANDFGGCLPGGSGYQGAPTNNLQSHPWWLKTYAYTQQTAKPRFSGGQYGIFGSNAEGWDVWTCPMYGSKDTYNYWNYITPSQPCWGMNEHLRTGAFHLALAKATSSVPLAFHSVHPAVGSGRGMFPLRCCAGCEWTDEWQKKYTVHEGQTPIVFLDGSSDTVLTNDAYRAWYAPTAEIRWNPR
jgi:prepilin-type N-terminal cleavage/methylation domain-containing protein